MRKILYILIIVFVFVSCAKIGTPTGGDYDRIPPKLKYAKPSIKALNFNEKSFELVFDEYVELNNPSEELLISPPLKNKPEVITHLNKIKVSWKDTLKENTTYIFDFGSAIVDFTEGNPVKNFAYSFSTGDFIDTMEYRGMLLDAYTLKPVARKYVMLYKSHNKEDIKKQKPDYLTRTDSNGYFRFQNISEGQYQILALDDKNQNLIYDLPTEAIAFSKELISSKSYLTADTIKKVSKKDINKFYFYEPADTLISLSSSKLLSNRKLELVFSESVSDCFDIKFDFPVLKGINDDNLVITKNKKQDTIILWALNDIKFDSLKINVIEKGLNQKVELYTKPTKNKEAEKFSFIKPNYNLPYFSECLLELPYVIKGDVDFKVIVISSKDTSEVDCKPYEKFPNSLFKIEAKWSKNENYKIKIKDSIMYNGIGQYNDSISFEIMTDSEEDYGSFAINLIDSALNMNNVILMLEDISGNIISEKYAKIGSIVRFINLKDGNYKLRLIEDRNNNRKWDCGDYDKDLMPERVIYFEKKIEVRKNWDLEEEWKL